jgi:glyoxylase-like metal-dependent hydrolase (beta-lactamase superfamily II)
MLELIDVRHLGREQVICCYRQDDVLIDPGPEVSSGAVFAALGDEAPRAILLTHIHLDHAGATGAIVRRWPGVEVWVHERGAGHIIDPSKLVASATRIYGDDMARLWGDIVPVPAENVRILQGGEQQGGWRVAYTPGHAQHHVSYLHEDTGTVFAGDVAGVRIDGGPILPPTPPPDIDLEAWRASLDVIEAWAPERLAVTHFGIYADVDTHLGELRESIRVLGDLARHTDTEGFAEAIRGMVRRRGGEELLGPMLQAMPPETLWPGLERYWRRRLS